MSNLTKRIEALEMVNNKEMRVIYIGTIAPLNWRDIVSVKITTHGIMRTFIQVFKEGTQYQGQKTYNKLSEEEQIKADEYLDALLEKAKEDLEYAAPIEEN